MENNAIEITHSKKSMASFACGTFLNEFLMMAFFAFSFFYYESEIGLNVWLVGLGYVIYAIWNAVNDPLVGYLTDRAFKFTKKWGRRFPWIIIGGIPWVFSYILVFTPPDVEPQGVGAWILFAWLVFTMCLYDTFASIFWVNYSSLFPDKFRTVEERRTANGFAILIGILGTVSGAVVPPLFISFGVLSSYIVQAGVVFLIGIIVMVLLIPGSRDDQILVDRYLAAYDEKIERTSFFRTLKRAMKQRNFIAVILILFFYQIMIRSMTASIPYIVRFLLNLDASAITVIMGLFMVSVIISTPFWVKLSQKKNDNRKVILITGTLLTIFTIPLIFVNTLMGFIIAMIIWGTVLGGFWVMQLPILSDVIDESVCITGKREEGIYMGFNQFFSRLAIVAQAISFAIVHSLTGFVEGADTQSAQALVGIQIHFAVIPLFAMLAGVIIFWKFYDLTPEKVAANQAKVKELCL